MLAGESLQKGWAKSRHNVGKFACEIKKKKNTS